MSVEISQLSFEHHRQALGIAETKPRISWRFEGDVADWEQKGYDIELQRGVNATPVLHSADSPDSLFVPWPEVALRSAEKADVRVRAHGKSGQPSTPWSDWVSVETGLLDDDSWAGAVPVAAGWDVDINAPKRPVYFRKPFSVAAGSSEDSIRSARLYITALGLYEAEINGKRIGDHVLAPGFQSFNHRHVYDTYDVTKLVRDGDNAIGVVVGEGWYAGRLFDGQRNNYGNITGHISLLVVTLADGSTVEVPSDASWKASTGPVVDSQIYNGETYDSRLEEDIQGWSTPSFKDGDWPKVKQIPHPRGQLVPPDGPPVKVLESLQPQQIFKSPSGKTLVDFGQNFVGWLRVSVSGPSGTNITFQHGEVLEDGELVTRTLRTAEATDHFILHGNGEQMWEPKFTFHGFRYVQIDGWPENGTPLTANALTGIVVYSDMEQTGFFECSNPLLNKLHSNVRWSMKGNFLSIPTDCPQRDERMGWTGDAHAFGPTANFLYNTAGFWRGWHKDVWSEMQAGGLMIPPAYVPTIPANETWTQPLSVWGDVVVGNPWNIWRTFGDRDLLAEQYSQAKAWIDEGVSRNEVGLWNQSTFQYADWLDPATPPDNPGDATTSKHLVSDAYLIGMTGLLANISRTLGHNDQAEKYSADREKLRKAFYDLWMEDGNMANETQTAYTLGVYFNIFNPDDVEHAEEMLRKTVTDKDYHVGTGFAGTPILGHALHQIGATDDFYRVLLQTDTPSWLFQVQKNGTTTWERWDSMLPNNTINPGEMTSFNHYAYGSVADWMHQKIGGIASSSPGWKTISVAPVPGGKITNAKTTYISGYGKVQSQWSIDKSGFHLKLQVPPNSRATVTLPNGGDPKEVGSGFHEFHDPDYPSGEA